MSLESTIIHDLNVRLENVSKQLQLSDDLNKELTEEVKIFGELVGEMKKRIKDLKEESEKKELLLQAYRHREKVELQKAS